MANLITPSLICPPDDLLVNVAYYDDVERKAIVRSLGEDILGDSSREVTVATPDLCTYYLYYKKRPGVLGWASHDDVRNKWPKAISEFDGQLDFTGDSLRLKQSAGSDRGTTERVGEAIGLSVVNKLHGLHDGDWGRIPETNRRKTFDFQRALASDGKRLISVEVKGSAVANNELKPPAVSNHKSSIKVKKYEIKKRGDAASVMYGTIAAIDDRDGSVARCWLVDPPVNGSGDPFRFKVLARLRYIAHWVSFFGARSQLAAALQSRLASLVRLPDIMQLSGVPLLNGSGEEFPVDTYGFGADHNQWFAQKSVVADEPVGGRVFGVDEKTIFFVGIQERLVGLAATQEYDEIAKYSFSAKVVWKSVECVVSRARYQKEFEKITQAPARSNRGASYVRFRMQGMLFFCQSGLVFGVLPIADKGSV